MIGCDIYGGFLIGTTENQHKLATERRTKREHPVIPFLRISSSMPMAMEERVPARTRRMMEL